MVCYRTNINCRGGGLCYLSRTLGMAVLYVTVFIIGYTFRKYEINIQWTTATALVVAALMIRLVSMILFDGTVLYDCLLVYLTHTILAVGLFFFGKQLCKVEHGKLIDWFDDISYFVYITHYMFMTGPIRTMGLTKSLFLNTVVTIILSFLSATILRLLYNHTVKMK